MGEMQHNSFFLGCNDSNRDFTTDARTRYSLCPVQDIDSVLTNRYGVNVNANADDTLSLFYCDLYLGQLKEKLKHTMLVQESIFESQIHELHRLYRRQKELMMEMDLNSSFPSSRTHWMNSSVSMFQTKNFPFEENIPNQIEPVDNVKKSEKMVLDLELPVFECHDREEERSLMNGKVTNFLKEQSLESGNQSTKLQLDLNEPAKIDEPSDYVFMSPVTSNEVREESDKKSEGEDSVKGSCWMNELQGFGIDLNMSPLEEEVNIVQKLETEKPQECLSEQTRVVVHALPCLNSSLLLNKPHSYKPRKKVKLDLHSSAQATSESQNNQATKVKGSSSSARNRTNLGKTRGNGDKVVVKKKRKKSRRISLVTEGNYQEVSAAEAMVDMSRKSDRETSDLINRNLLWLAEISSLVVEGYQLDYCEATTLQLTEMNLEEHKTILRSSSADNKTADSSIVLRKQRSKAKRKCKDDQHDYNPSLSGCEAGKDVQVIEKLVKVSDSKWTMSKSSPPKPIEVFTWGSISKRRRGSRIPAADFQHMIIN